MVWLVCSGAFAQQYSSEVDEVLFEDSLDLFSAATFDTGYLPSINDPVSVRFHITPSGGVQTAIPALSHLEWPTALQHRFEGLPGEGSFAIDSHVDVEFEVHIDVAGIYQASIPVVTESFDVFDAMSFDTLVLPGSSEAPVEIVVQDRDLVDPFSYDIDVVPGLAALEFEVLLIPEIFASLAGDRVESTLGASVGAIDAEGAGAVLDLPAGGPAEVLLQSVYHADITTLFTLVIEPTARLDTTIGDFDLVNLPIPIELLSGTQSRAFAPTEVTHPLPSMALPESAYDFGEVEIGRLRTLELSLTNLGAMGLEGTAHVEGAQSFTVFPEIFYANEGTTDGVVVSFLPTGGGGQGATLVLTSNDPAVPEYRISLEGAGYEPVEPEPPEPDPEPEPEPDAAQAPPSEGGKTCGCQSATPLMAGWTFLLVALIARRR